MSNYYFVDGQEITLLKIKNVIKLPNGVKLTGIPPIEADRNGYGIYDEVVEGAELNPGLYINIHTLTFAGNKVTRTITNELKSQEEQDKYLAQEAKKVADAEAVAFATSDEVIEYLATHTPEEASVWVQGRSNTIPEIKEMLGKFAMALSVLVRNDFQPIIFLDP